MTERKRVAIVDDDRDMVQTLRDILELHGWETLTSYDGEDAVSLSETGMWTSSSWTCECRA